MPGPSIRTNIVEMYVFTRSIKQQGELAFLQLKRARQPMAGSWQPVMGHIEQGETTVAAGLRELAEETGLSPRVVGKGDQSRPCVWQLEAVNTFFLASIDAILMCPALAVEVEPDAKVTIDDAHDDFRWVSQRETDAKFLWPGQRTAARQIIEEIVPSDGRLHEYLRLPV